MHPLFTVEPLRPKGTSGINESCKCVLLYTTLNISRERNVHPLVPLAVSKGTLEYTFTLPHSDTVQVLQLFTYSCSSPIFGNSLAKCNFGLNQCCISQCHMAHTNSHSNFDGLIIWQKLKSTSTST